MNDNTNDTTDNVSSIRDRLRAVSEKSIPTPTEPVATGVSGDQPTEDMWEITTKDEVNRYVLAHGFYSFNPLGVVIAKTQPDGTHLVECIVPWDNVSSLERVHMDDVEDMGDGGSAN